MTIAPFFLKAALQSMPRWGTHAMLGCLRLGSGLILFSFVLTHLLNHLLGLHSVEAMEAGRRWFLLVWRSRTGTWLLAGAFLIHFGLALWSIYRRRSLAMPIWEAAQMILGLAIPPLLVLHVLGTRFAAEQFGIRDTYTYILLTYWVYLPMQGIKQTVTLVVAWVHGCIGLHFWLRLKPRYASFVPLAYAGALLVPVLSLLGFAVAGRQVARLARDPVWLRAALAEIRPADAQSVELVYRLETQILIGLAALLTLTFAARGIRLWVEKQRDRVYVVYPDGRRVSVEAGSTILETSRAAGIPHASVCGGRGRCSTCRVRVSRGLEALPPPSMDEMRVLARVGAAPNVRLACQTRPTADVEVTPLLSPDATPRDALPGPGYRGGEEREIAILFADLRGFTTLSEDKLPYDVVFVLNQYFRAMGRAVEEAGGRLDKFLGDGVMALFGIDRGIQDGSRRALAAARWMAERLAELNASLQHDLARPLRMGVGIHAGAVIVGEMGYGPATSLTAIGDAVNTASRVEALTKDYGAELVVSQPVVDWAGVDFSAFPRHETEIRGRAGRLCVFVVQDARELPIDLGGNPDAFPE